MYTLTEIAAEMRAATGADSLGWSSQCLVADVARKQILGKALDKARGIERTVQSMAFRSTSLGNGAYQARALGTGEEA